MKIKNPRICFEFTLSIDLRKEYKTETTCVSHNYLNSSFAVESIELEKRFNETHTNPLVKQILIIYSILVIQPCFTLQQSFQFIFDKEGYSVDDVKESYFELVIDTFVNVKMKQILHNKSEIE